jgi:hypothetical protein
VSRRAALYAKFAWLAFIAACNKPEPAIGSPSTDAVGVPEPGSKHDGVETPPTKIARVDLDAEFHRSRIGSGHGFWVLGMIHNPHDHAITDARARVRLLDAEGKSVGEADAAVDRSLAPDARAAVAVLVAEPVEHEQLELRASGIPSSAEPAQPLTLKLEHEPPQRGELGGWFVQGTVTNTGAATIEGARLEVQGLDRSGRLLGVDWLQLDPVAAGAMIEFDLGELRYEQAPAQFVITLVAGLG